MWNIYCICWDFVTNLCAGVPSDPNLVQAWLNAREPEAIPPGGKSIDEIQEEVFQSLATVPPAPVRLVFQRHNGNLVVRAAWVRAHLKDCARTLSSQYIGKMKGQRSFSTRVINGLYTHNDEYWIPIRRPDGTFVTVADGTLDRAVHARSATGMPLNALKSFEFVFPASLFFRLLCLGESVQEEDLETLFRYGGVHGFGGERGAGEGKYTFTIAKEKETHDEDERHKAPNRTGFD